LDIGFFWGCLPLHGATKIIGAFLTFGNTWKLNAGYTGPLAFGFLLGFGERKAEGG
jgi:hypothetical protein